MAHSLVRWWHRSAPAPAGYTGGIQKRETVAMAENRGIIDRTIEALTQMLPYEGLENWVVGSTFGGAVVAALAGWRQYLLDRSVDWWGVVGLFGWIIFFSLILLFLQRKEEVENTAVATSEVPEVTPCRRARSKRHRRGTTALTRNGG
jgi:hypothetical protein